MAETEITEFTDLDPDELHHVKRGANGFPHLLAKAAAEEVQGALKGDGEPHDEDTESEEADQMEEDALKFVSAEQRREDAKSGVAMPDGSFPIPDEGHLRSAIGRLAEYKGNKAKAKQHIIKRARALGATHLLPAKWKAGGAEKSPGVPGFSVEMPKEVGHITDTGQSGKRMAPLARGTKRPLRITTPGGETPAVGGANTAVIPLTEDITSPPPATLTAKMAYAFTALAQFMDQVDARRASKGEWLAQPNGDAASDPSSGPWEAYDSASLTEVAQLLAACGKAIDAIQTREAVEAVSGNAGDYQDTADLGVAGDALDCALSIVARLAFHEGAAKEEDAEKSGRRLSQKTETALRAARDHLTAVLGEDKSHAGHTGTPSEEDEIMTTLTKEELDQQVAEASKKAAKAAMKAERQRAVKAAKKAAKKAERKARKNANNGGDITAGEMQDQVHGHVDANDVDAIPDGGKVDSQYTNKRARKAKKGGLVKKIDEMQDVLNRMASRPRAGGPNLTGVIPAGFGQAAEGRQGKVATKSAEDADIDRLEKELAEAQSKTGAEAANRASQISWQLTRKRLLQGHRLGEI